jgi:5-formyltetrahydrofolate cyclo-ligase
VASSGATKADARAAVRARRSRRSALSLSASARALAAAATILLPPEALTVSCYRSMTDEPGTAPLIEALLSRGDQVLLPRINGRSLQWVEVSEDTDYVKGPMGIKEPSGHALPAEPPPLAAAGLVFLPALSVDRHGRRLGQGGGYYDKVLARLPRHDEGGPLRVAVLFEDEFVDEVPFEPHDCVVDAVLMPGRVVRIAAPEGTSSRG